MKFDIIPSSTFSIFLPIGLLFFLFIFSQRQTIKEKFDFQSDELIENRASYAPDLISDNEKQRGAHIFGIGDSTDFQPMFQNNLEWVTLVSWGFQEDFDSPNVTHHNGDSLYILKHNAHWQARIEQVRAAGFKVFFKPHLWIDSPSDGKWRASIYPTNDENWEVWQKTYRDFILRYAKIAELANAEMFCIGGEFAKLTVKKPIFWKNLIQEIRGIYSGKLTYAANWYEEYEKVTFWEDLDYIGIQAYFPLTKKEYPSVEQLSKGWKKHLPAIESIHKKYNRKVIFTEMGYKSTTDSAVRPWEWIEDPASQGKILSTETQANCYEAFFNTVWNKEWFAGVHIWQMRIGHKKYNSKNNLDFTPQGKPAEDVIAMGFE